MGGLMKRLENLEQMNDASTKFARMFTVCVGLHEVFGYDVNYQGTYPEGQRGKKIPYDLTKEPGIPDLENGTLAEYQEYKTKYFQENSEMILIDIRSK